MAEVPRFVSREGWGAAAPRDPPSPMLGPIEHVCFTYSTGGRACVGDQDCSELLREMQAAYMANRCQDLPYSFLVGGDGTVYEGRGWDAKPSAHLGPSNRSQLPRLDIAFIGQYRRETLPKEMYFRGIDTVYHGVRNRLICRQYSFQENRQALSPSAATTTTTSRRSPLPTRWTNFALKTQSMTSEANYRKKTYNGTTFTKIEKTDDMLLTHLHH